MIEIDNDTFRTINVMGRYILDIIVATSSTGLCENRTGIYTKFTDMIANQAIVDKKDKKSI